MAVTRAPAAFREFEKRFTAVVHTHSRFAPTGEPHVELTGEGQGCLADAEDAAVKAANDYAEGRSGTLYWRIVPELRHTGGATSPWSFYMRLLISDKEPLTS